ncbi:MAG: hypothetical protein HYS55_02480 [Candidatus Omnitrophica bacterium]|nr:hypothetical protein [Candidatus Omnitrophota bacterium]
MFNIPRLKKILLFTSVCASIFILALFSSIPLLIRSQYLEEFVTKAIQNQSGYLSSFQGLRVSFFPTPVLHIESFELKPEDGNTTLPLVRADKAAFRPSLFSLLIGKPELAHVVLNHMDIHYTWRSKDGKVVKTVSLKDANLDLWNIRESHPIRFRLKGKFLSGLENVELEGTFESDFKNFRMKDLIVKSEFSIGPVELVHLAGWWGGALPLEFQKGTGSFSGTVLKKEGSSELVLDGKFNVQDLVYRIPPKPVSSLLGNYQSKFQVTIDLASGALAIRNGILIAPFGGPFDFELRFNMFKFFVEEILIKSKEVRLDTLPPYLLSFTELLPVNLGFSGHSQIDFYGKGGPGLLTINSRMDLTGTTLNYSKYFSKPSGTPLFLKSDLKLLGGKVLRGNFSLEFEQASMKGSIVNLDLVSGECEVTILTNKFTIDGWQQYFPTLRQFALSGGVKVLTSFKGNYRFLDQARFMNNVTFDHLAAGAANGAQLGNLSGSIDFGPIDSELHHIRFDIGNTPFTLEGKMLRSPDSRWLVNLQSSAIDLRDLVSQLRKISEATQWEGGRLNWDSIETRLTQVVGADETLERFATQVAWSKDRILIPELNFNAFDGSVTMRADFNQSTSSPRSLIDFQVDRISLARMQAGHEQPLLQGNLFGVGTVTSEGPLDGGWLERLKGRGSISVTNGELRSVDILGGLSEIAELASLKSFESGVTRFSDVRGDFGVGNRKVTTENLFLVSEDFEIQAAGDLNFDGNLNFRLSVFLSPPLSQRIAPGLGENMRLGPIPILIVGPITKPAVRKDPMLIGTFAQQLLQQQFSKIASRFVPTPPQNEKPSSQEQHETTSTEGGKPKRPQSMEQALVDSGFSLLENFFSQKKTSSS